MHDTLLNAGPNPELNVDGAVTNVCSNPASPKPCCSSSYSFMPVKGFVNAREVASNTVCEPPLILSSYSSASKGSGFLHCDKKSMKPKMQTGMKNFFMY